MPAPVAAQVIRDPRRVGRLLALSGTSGVVDGFVAVKAAETGATVITSDPGDIRHVLSTLGLRLPVLKP